MKSRILLSIIFLLTFVFVQISAAQNLSYPNELKGYRFFGEGRLKQLKLGVSNKEDVKRLFGENCESSCDYDHNWIVQFSYFDVGNTKQVTVDNKTTNYIPSSKAIGKLYAVTLLPKSTISFRKAGLLAKFNKNGGGGSAAHDGLGGGVNTTFDTYTDGYGLEYRVLDSIKFTKIKNSPKWRKGDLISIQYQLLDEIEERMFVEQK